MTPLERRAAATLAGVFGLRMLGMFIILPVFALYAQGLPEVTPTLIGLALGAYGLTQAALQLPFGWASDRMGRRKVALFGLALFALGSFVAAATHNIYLIILGRALQGAGAISAVVIAWLADLTRESHRTKAMAMVGATIGLTFGVSFVLSPVLNAAIGVPGLFALTGVLALAAMALLAFALPEPARHGDQVRVPFTRVLTNAALAKLNFGIFVLHAVLMALFVIVPLDLKSAGLAPKQHWMVYLGVLTASIVFAAPLIMKSEKWRWGYGVSIALVAASCALMLALPLALAAMCAALLVFFAGFNVLESMLPSRVSRAAPREARGAATGVYSTLQFAGTFVGAAAGGWLLEHAGRAGTLWFCLALTLAWFVVEQLGMKRSAPGTSNTADVGK